MSWRTPSLAVWRVEMSVARALSGKTHFYIAVRGRLHHQRSRHPGFRSRRVVKTADPRATRGHIRVGYRGRRLF